MPWGWEAILKALGIRQEPSQAISGTCLQRFTTTSLALPKQMSSSKGLADKTYQFVCVMLPKLMVPRLAKLVGIRALRYSALLVRDGS